MKRHILGLSIVAATLGGCAQDDYLRTEGLSMTAGDAMARNSALQIIDPWPEGVEDTTLLVPADRSVEAAADEEAAAPATTTNP